MLPDILSAQVYVDAVASNYNKFISAYSGDDPSTALFQLRQVSEYLKSGTVLCGVYDSSSGSFALTFDNSNEYFNVARGNIRYNGIDYLINDTQLKYAPLFNPLYYSNSDYYIATIYANIKTLNNNKLVNFTTAQPITSGDTVLYVREKSELSSLTVPFKIQIGSTLYQAGSVDVYSAKITLASSAGTISSDVDTGTRIYAIQEPLISCVYTSPFSNNGSDAFLSDHINKTAIPQYALRLYDILMSPPSAPRLVSTGGIQQLKTNFINFYSQEYDEDKAQNLSNAIDAFRASLIQSQSFLDIDLALSNFNAATQQYTLSGNVSAFWLDTPLLQPEIVSAGVDLGRYKKFDFPDDYLKANSDYNSSNLYELLYAFDPINYSNRNIFSSSGSISNITTSFISNYGPVSAATPSVVVHGVTATSSTVYPSGETPASYVSTSQDVSLSENCAFEIKFDELSSSTFNFYNVYRKAVNSNLSVDLPLSTPFEISGDTGFGSFLPASPISGSQNYSGFTGAYTILTTSGYQSKFAFEFKTRLPGGSVEDTVYIGGAAVYLSGSASYSGNATVQLLLVQPNPSLSSYTLLGSSDLMFVNKLTTTPTEYAFKFNPNLSVGVGSLNLAPSTTYYILVVLGNADSTSTNKIYGHTTTATGSTIAQGFTGSWGNIPSLAFNFRTLGFVDNLSNSGSAINTSLPLSGYVFKGIRQIRNKLTSAKSIYAYVPYFKVDAYGQKISTYTTNEMLVRVVGVDTQTGNVVDTGYVSVPAESPSGQKILLTGVDVIDKITYVSVEPGSDVTLDTNGQVVWGKYDYLLIIGDES